MASNIIKHGVLKDIIHTPYEIKQGIVDEPVFGFVDFRLPSGNLWSRFNLLANTPKDVGYYFFWGDVNGCSKERVASRNFNQYNKEIESYLCSSEELKIQGIIDESYHLIDAHNPCLKTNLQAYIPSVEDWEELLEYCTFTWATSYKDPVSGETYTSVKGYIVTRNPAKGSTGENYNTNTSIFLPATGLAKETEIVNDKNGYYWTNFAEPGTHNSFHLIFDEKASDIAVRQNYRYNGMPIRPVFKANRMASDTKLGMVKLSEKDWELEKPYQGRIGRNPDGVIYAVNAHSLSSEDIQKAAVLLKKEGDLYKSEPWYAIPGTVALCHSLYQYNSPKSPYYDSEYITPNIFDLKTEFSDEERVGMTDDEVKEVIRQRIALKQYGFDSELYAETIQHIAVPHWDVVWKLNGYMYGQLIKNPKYNYTVDPKTNLVPKLVLVGSVAKDLYGFVYEGDDRDLSETIDAHVVKQVALDSDTPVYSDESDLGIKLRLNGGVLEVDIYEGTTGRKKTTVQYPCRGLFQAIYGGEDYYKKADNTVGTQTIPGLYKEIYGTQPSYAQYLDNNWSGLSSVYSTSNTKGIIRELYDENQGLITQINALKKAFLNLPCVGAGIVAYDKKLINNEL